MKDSETLSDGTCQWCKTKRNEETYECPNGCSCGEQFQARGLTFFTAWMREADWSMWINEQPNGGFEWKILDFKPLDAKTKFVEVFISPKDPRTAFGITPPPARGVAE